MTQQNVSKSVLVFEGSVNGSSWWIDYLSEWELVNRVCFMSGSGGIVPRQLRC